MPRSRVRHATLQTRSPFRAPSDAFEEDCAADAIVCAVRALSDPVGDGAGSPRVSRGDGAGPPRNPPGASPSKKRRVEAASEPMGKTAVRSPAISSQRRYDLRTSPRRAAADSSSSGAGRRRGEKPFTARASPLLKNKEPHSLDTPEGVPGRSVSWMHYASSFQSFGKSQSQSQSQLQSPVGRVGQVGQGCNSVNAGGETENRCGAEALFGSGSEGVGATESSLQNLQKPRVFFRKFSAGRQSQESIPGNGDEFSMLLSEPRKYHVHMHESERSLRKNTALVPITLPPRAPPQVVSPRKRPSPDGPAVEFIGEVKEEAPSRLRRSRRRRRPARRRVRVVKDSPATPIELGRATRVPDEEGCSKAEVAQVTPSADQVDMKGDLPPHRQANAKEGSFLESESALRNEHPTDRHEETGEKHSGHVSEADLQDDLPVGEIDKSAAQREGTEGPSSSLPVKRVVRSSPRLLRRRSRLGHDVLIDLTQNEDDACFRDSQEAGQLGSTSPPDPVPVVQLDLEKGMTPHPHACGPVEVVIREAPVLEKLSDEDVLIVNALTTGRRNEDKLATIPSAHITLKRTDFKRLRGTRWLNDEVLNSYVALINDRNHRYFSTITWGRDAALRPRTYMFNSFFYSRLESGPDGYDYSGVARWSRRAKLDVLEKDLILISVNIGNHHWVLVGIDMRNECFMYLDSLAGGGHSHKVLPVIKKWLYDEVLDKHGVGKANDVGVDAWPHLLNKYFYFVPQEFVAEAELPSAKKSPSQISKKLKIPRQRDGGSCGVFTAKIADCLELGRRVYFNHEHIKLIRSRMALDLYRRFLPG